jgi:6-phosphogluconolactonase (cycloisomerase 2 family)
MKFSKLSQLFLVSTIGLLVATLLTSCEITTIDYVFVASSQGSGSGTAGQIQTYDADSETGALRTGQPAVASGGSSPVAMAVSSDYQNLYVANQGNNSVVHFAIAGNGALTQKDAITTSTTPVSLAVNQANSYLYVVSGTTSATLTAYALSSGTIGAATASEPLSLGTVSSSYGGDTIIPTGVFALANNEAVYVSAYDKSAYNPGQSTSSRANPGWVFAFAVSSGGALTPTSGSPFKAGVKPSGLAAEPTNRFVYVTDFASNELIAYSIQAGYNLNFLLNGPFKTGNEPQALAIDPRGLYIYVANSLDNTVSAFIINVGTGTPSTVSAATVNGSTSTDTTPVAVVVDASLGRFVYTANHLGNSVSGFELNPSSGALGATVATPYPSGDQPSAIVSVPNGSHSVQVVTP